MSPFPAVTDGPITGGINLPSPTTGPRWDPGSGTLEVTPDHFGGLEKLKVHLFKYCEKVNLSLEPYLDTLFHAEAQTLLVAAM